MIRGGFLWWEGMVSGFWSSGGGGSGFGWWWRDGTCCDGWGKEVVVVEAVDGSYGQCCWLGRRTGRRRV